MSDAVPPTPAQPDPPQGPTQGALSYLTKLQGDGRLLLRYLMEMPNRSSIAAEGDPAHGVTPAILFEPPASLIADSAQTVRLIRYVDYLSRIADPVSLATVRETYRFLGQDNDLNGSTANSRRWTYAWRWLWNKKGLTLAGLLGLCLLVLSVYFLMQVDDGRRTMQQLAANRADVTAVYNDLGKVEGVGNWVIHKAANPFPPPPHDPTATPAAPPPAVPALAPFIPFCHPPMPALRIALDAARTTPLDQAKKTAEDINKANIIRIFDELSWRIPATPQADALCARLGEYRLREALIFIRLTAWNERLSGVATMFSFKPFSLDYPQCPPVTRSDIAWPSHVACDDWQRTELRTAATIAVLTGYVLPLMLGGIGGCVASIRRLQIKVAQRTLNDSDSFNCLLQVILGMTLGGLLGAVFSTDQPVQLGEYRLTLVALGFFVGFSLEVVFGLLDALVKSVTGLLQVGKPPG